jgi:hypothetical protein
MNGAHACPVTVIGLDDGSEARAESASKTRRGKGATIVVLRGLPVVLNGN